MTEPGTLLDAFSAAFQGKLHPKIAENERALHALQAALEKARSAHPELEVDGRAFAVALGAALADTEEPCAALEALRAEDFYLAFACTLGEPRALAKFEKEHLQNVGDFVARIDRSEAFVDDVKQELREKLFVGREGGPPKIAEYHGNGALGGWVRIAAVRTALNLKRSEKRRRESPLLTGDSNEKPHAGASSDDPELAGLRRLLGDDFRRALEATLAALPAEERTVLRMHYLDGLTTEELAQLNRVHRSTIARWLERARTRILDETQARLRQRLGSAPSAPIDSILRLVRSELDVSVARLLRETRGSRTS